jgi:hypothetical protein
VNDANGIVSSNTTLIPQVAANTAAITSLQTLTSQHTTQIDALFSLVDDNNNRATEGVALALAMDSPSLPPGTSFGMSGGVGYYDDKAAGTVAFSARIGTNSAFSAGVGVGFDSGEVGARAGFQAAW